MIKENSRTKQISYMFLAVAALLPAADIAATELVAEVNIQTQANSNIFLDNTSEFDWILRPSIEMGLDFGSYYSVGYRGLLSAYTDHKELLAHWHELYFFINPAWGDNGENELVVELSLETLRNQADYAALNLIQPTVLAKLVIEPKSWFRYQLSVKSNLRLFYDDDKQSDSIDAWVSGAATFTLPSRTTISPRIAYGYRHYLRGGAQQIMDKRDQQLEFGLHLSQAIWARAGLQFDYTYLLAFDDSGIISRYFNQPQTEAQFAYLGQEFLYSGHRAEIGLKQLFGKSVTGGVSVGFEKVVYAGWLSGHETDEDRADTRYVPRAYLSFSWWAGDDQVACVPDINLSVEYRFVRQVSNSDIYDTSAHIVGLALLGLW
ncbi:MAG: hypothetical protein JRJ87_27255 [Deltaproteobacteria bacterium]|nr:hypothetical protein [Deltaproteobacteria bacterium]